jgi:hypothetical protein
VGATVGEVEAAQGATVRLYLWIAADVRLKTGLTRVRFSSIAYKYCPDAALKLQHVTLL